MRVALFGGAALAWSRVGRLRTLVVAALAIAGVAAAADWERVQAPSMAVDRSLTGVAFGLAVPLLAYYLIREITARRRLDHAVFELARHGVNRRWASLGLLGAGAGLLAILGGLVAAAAVIGARGFADPRDLAVSMWLGVLAGLSYAWLMGLGACVGRSGEGRLGSLAMDWFLGAGTSALAVPWPRGHLRNLLGAEPVLDLTQPAAMLSLTGLIVVYLGLTLWRTPR